MRIGILLVLFVSFFSHRAHGQLTLTKDKVEQEKKELIHQYITKLMKADGVPGMAVAVIDGNKTIFEKYYGNANIEHQVPVTEKTLFRVYSTSKLVTAVAIFQLVEKQKLDLSDSIGSVIDGLPISWKGIKVEHLLVHSSGLPEYKSYDSSLSDLQLIKAMAKEQLRFSPGSRFEYNQTNFWFLKKIVEKVSGQTFKGYIKANQFFRPNSRAIFASNSLVAIRSRVSKYQYDKSLQAYRMSTFEAGPRSVAGNGLNTNLKTLIAWSKDLDSGRLVLPATLEKMLARYPYKDDDQDFGWSWGRYGPPGKRYYGFAGGGVCALMKFPKQKLTIIILSNGFKDRPIISNAFAYISGLCDPDLIRKDRMKAEDSRLSEIATSSTKN